MNDQLNSKWTIEWMNSTICRLRKPTNQSILSLYRLLLLSRARMNAFVARFFLIPDKNSTFEKKKRFKTSIQTNLQSRKWLPPDQTNTLLTSLRLEDDQTTDHGVTSRWKTNEKWCKTLKMANPNKSNKNPNDGCKRKNCFKHVDTQSSVVNSNSWYTRKLVKQTINVRN